MQNDEKEIRELVATWMAATKAADFETVLDLMAEDVVFLVPGQAPFGKSTFAEASKAQSATSVEFDGKSEVQEVKILGDWAYMLTELTVTAAQLGGNKPMVRLDTPCRSFGSKVANGDWHATRTYLLRLQSQTVAPNNSFKPKPLRGST